MLMGIGKVVRPSQREVIRQKEGGRRASLRGGTYLIQFLVLNFTLD